MVMHHQPPPGPSLFMRERRPDAALFAAVVGSVLGRARGTVEGVSSRVVAFGEMVGLLWAERKLGAPARTTLG
jgi:hypothetical protein